jgi:hypothetical protein
VAVSEHCSGPSTAAGDVAAASQSASARQSGGQASGSWAMRPWSWQKLATARACATAVRRSHLRHSQLYGEFV